MQKLSLTLILLLALGLRLVNLNQSFWLDEAAQLIESARPLSQQLQIAGDFQPPLFHILLHFWLYGGTNEIWIRLLPVTFSLVTIYLTYLFGLQLKNKTYGLLWTLFVVINPFFVWYSQEVRPYALSVLLGLTATYFLLKKHYVGYVISAILLLYTLYIGPFLLIAHGVWIWWQQRKEFTKFLVASTIIIAAFIPWMPSFWEQLGIGTGLTTTLPGWGEAVSTPLFKVVPLVFAKFVLGRITIDNKLLYSILIVGLFGGFFSLFITAWKQEKKYINMLSIFTGVPILLVFLISFFIPIIAPQRLLFTLPFFCGIISFGVLSLSNNFQKIAIGFIGLVSVISLTMYYVQPRFQREQWRQAVDFVEQTASPHSIVLFVFPDTFAPWQWYSSGRVEGIGIAPRFVLTENDLESVTNRVKQYDTVYVFDYLTDLTDKEEKTQRILKEQGFIETQIVDFPGVGFIYVYEKFIAHS